MPLTVPPSLTTRPPVSHLLRMATDLSGSDHAKSSIHQRDDVRLNDRSSPVAPGRGLRTGRSNMQCNSPDWPLQPSSKSMLRQGRSTPPFQGQASEKHSATCGVTVPSPRRSLGMDQCRFLRSSAPVAQTESSGVLRNVHSGVPTRSPSQPEVHPGPPNPLLASPSQPLLRLPIPWTEEPVAHAGRCNGAKNVEQCKQCIRTMAGTPL